MQHVPKQTLRPLNLIKPTSLSIFLDFNIYLFSYLLYIFLFIHFGILVLYLIFVYLFPFLYFLLIVFYQCGNTFHLYMCISVIGVYLTVSFTCCTHCKVSCFPFLFICDLSSLRTRVYNAYCVLFWIYGNFYNFNCLIWKAVFSRKVHYSKTQ